MKKRSLISLLFILNIGLVFTGCGKTRDSQLELKEQGIAAMEAKDYDGAVNLFNQALGLSIGKVTELEKDLCYYKAAAQYNGKDFEGAIETYTALINYEPENYKPYFLRGCLYADESEIQLAVKDFDVAVELEKKNYDLYIQIFSNLCQLNYRDYGLEYMNKALDLEDKSAEGLYYKGRIYYMLAQYDKAEEYLQQAMDKDVVEADLYMAKVYKDQGDDSRAQLLLEEYAKSDEISSVALGELGDIEATAGDYESALSYYDAGLTLESIENEQQLLKGKIVALENLGRFGEARELMAQYIELYGGDESAVREYEFLKTR